MLGMLPDIQDAPTINQALYIPLQPGRPAGAPKGPIAVAAPDTAAKPIPAARPGLTVPATTLPPARDARHEAALPPAHVIGASVVPATAAAAPLAAR